MFQFKQTPKLAYSLLFIAVACGKSLNNQSDYSSIIQGDATNKPKGLGQGFDSETEQLRSSCLKGNVVYQGVPESKLTFVKDLSFDDMLATISGGLKLGANFGTFDVKGQAEYAAKTAATDYSETFTVTSVNTAKSAILSDETLTDLGKTQVTEAGIVLDSVKTFCGNEFVSQVDYGSRFSTTVKFNFASKQDKEEFSGSAAVSIANLGSIEGAIQKLSDHLLQTSSVSIYISQVGGAPEQINKLINSSVFSCGLANFKACNVVLENITKYMAEEFNTQLSGDPSANTARGWAQLNYITTPYKERMVLSGTRGVILEPEKPSPILTQEIKQTREDIYNNYKKELQNYQRAEELLNHFSLSTLQITNIKKMHEYAGNNRARLAAVGQNCYKNPTGCLAEKSFYEKNKDQYDETVLEIAHTAPGELQPNTKYIVFNSVANEGGISASGDKNTYNFWQIPYNARLTKKGIESLTTNFYNPTLYANEKIYSAGGALYFDEIEDLKGKVVTALVTSATGFDPLKMTFQDPQYIAGNVWMYDFHFAGGWSSADYDGDNIYINKDAINVPEFNCAQLAGNISQHYSQFSADVPKFCQIYNLGTNTKYGNVEVSEPNDSSWGPHVFDTSLELLGLYHNEDSAQLPAKSGRVKRITRYVMFLK